MSDEFGKCPWKLAPNTLEEMLESVQLQLAWEKDNKRKAPYEWHMLFTTKLMGDIVQRLLIVESKLLGGA